MNNMIILDLETQSFYVESGIYEVAAIVVEDWKIIDRFYLGIIEDESQIHLGYGYGYKNISQCENCIEDFKNFIKKYNYPIVAHNGSFDKKFLVHHEWLEDNYPFYDSIRAIRYKNPKLFSYSLAHLIDFLSIEKPQSHTAMEDVEMLFDILSYFKPDRWIPIGVKSSSVYSGGCGKNLTAIKEDFNVIHNLFTGKNIVFTGKGPYTRNQLMELAKKCGADITSNNITKKTNLLVVGEDSGSKLEKANSLGIEIMAMDDFFHMVDGVPLDNVNDYISNNKMDVDAVLKKEILVLSEELRGKSITLFPMKQGAAERASRAVEQHGGVSLFGLRKKETSLLVYQPYAEDLTTVQKAKGMGIPTMTLGKFNKYILDIEKNLLGE